MFIVSTHLYIRVNYGNEIAQALNPQLEDSNHDPVDYESDILTSLPLPPH